MEKSKLKLQAGAPPSENGISGPSLHPSSHPDRYFMRPVRKTHPEFAVADGYDYPQHLRAEVESAPQAPGIYIFHGPGDGLPLYIGKSVNLRARLLSHLRNVQEARMLRQTRRISIQRTTGEVGALLLEARLIKQLQPLYNQKLRRSRQLCAWQFSESGLPLQLVFSRDVNFSRSPRLYGLYSSRHAAIDALRMLAGAHGLCDARLGLEKVAAGRPCFRATLKQCAGACCGREDAASHDARLLAAMASIQVHCWPYSGAIGLIERWENELQVHAIDQWCYLGSADDIDAARLLQRQAVGFDADGYKILCKPLLGGNPEVVAL